MCGIVGFIGHKKVVYDLVLGMTSLQHRGQDAAGIVCFDKVFHTKKGLGLVNTVFKEKHFKMLKGKIGLGHVRYTTNGSNNLDNAQPISMNYPIGISMVHNGNVTNFQTMREKIYAEYHTLSVTNNDLELILYTFAEALKEKDLSTITPQDIFDAVCATQEQVEGAYAVISVIANHGLLGFCDPNGIRPLLLGMKETKDGPKYGFASESVCFDHLGYKVIDYLQPGEIVFIDKNMKIHKSRGVVAPKRFCVFEMIYFSRDDSQFGEHLVAADRVHLGKKLANQVRSLGLKPDIVIDVPSSGYFAASGLAEELGIPYRRGLIKNNYIGRSFIAPKQKEREKIVIRKINAITQVVEGKKVVVVDDSIVRGTTSRLIVKILRKAGAKEIYFVSAAPPVIHPCIYGIDMSISTELIAANKTNVEIKDFINADAIIYLAQEDLIDLYPKNSICTACFTGDYPTAEAQNAIKIIEEERLEYC